MRAVAVSRKCQIRCHAQTYKFVMLVSVYLLRFLKYIHQNNIGRMFVKCWFHGRASWLYGVHIVNWFRGNVTLELNTFASSGLQGWCHRVFHLLPRVWHHKVPGDDLWLIYSPGIASHMCPNTWGMTLAPRVFYNMYWFVIQN